MTRKQWVCGSSRAGGRPADSERQATTAACEKLIRDVLKPRYLPEIRRTQFSYPIDIYDRWHGHRYRFVQRYRSDQADAVEAEFEVGFTRLDWVAPDRFDLLWLRHTGEWWRQYASISLAEALQRIEAESLFHPR